MNLNGKLAILVVAIALVVGSGCGGVRASHSVSPATFLLPGFGSTSPEHQTPCERARVPEAPELATLN